LKRAVDSRIDNCETTLYFLTTSIRSIHPSRNRMKGKKEKMSAIKNHDIYGLGGEAINILKFRITIYTIAKE